MPNKPNNLGQFWHELKRRRVIHVITVYATAAFVIIELVNNLAEPLNLPARLPIIIVVVLAVGFPLVIILSWIYDLMSEGGLVVLNVMGGGKQLRAGDIQSLVVLPFDNFTGDNKLEYMVAGMHSSLITDLGRLSGLRVISHTSSKLFKDSGMSASEIASALNVDAVVEASILCLGDKICFQPKMIGGFPEEEQIWVGDYEEEKLTQVRQHDPDLLEAIYKGKFYMEQLTEEGFRLGQRFYNDAIAIDPSDPLPYLGLALGYSTSGHVSDLVPEADDRAIAYAHQALTLDSTLAEAYVVLAARALYTDWDFTATERYLKRAMDLNPNLPIAHYHYGWLMMAGNHLEAAIAEFKKTIELDPINPLYISNLGGLYLWIGRYEEALTEARKSLDLNPNYPPGLGLLGSAYAGLGMYEEAIETHQKCLAINPGLEDGLAIAYALSGQREKALEIAVQLEEINNKWSAFSLSIIYVALGDNDKAIYWTEEAYQRRYDYIPWIKYNALFKSLIEDPRFQEIIQRLNLPG
jgi:tetratricopeptide (TPR) repeat protein